MLTGVFCCTIFSGSGVGAQPAASADASRRATELIAQGQRHMAEGKHAQALQSFDAAKALSPLPEADYYAGLALEALDRGAEAAKRYRAYLAASPQASNRPEVESRIERLERNAAANAPPPPVPPPSPPGAPSWAAPGPAGTTPVMYGEDEPPMPQHRYPSAGSLVQKWWFWATVVGIVAAGITAGAVVASSENADSSGN